MILRATTYLENHLRRRERKQICPSARSQAFTGVTPTIPPLLYFLLSTSLVLKKPWTSYHHFEHDCRTNANETNFYVTRCDETLFHH